MPKRKADQSVDEWLEEGALAAEDRRTLASSEYNQECNWALPTAEGQSAYKATVPDTGASSTVAPTAHTNPAKSYVASNESRPVPADVATETSHQSVLRAVNEEEASDWFWRLLKQAGYEPV